MEKRAGHTCQDCKAYQAEAILESRLARSVE